eukprot:gb/GEZN01020700.1/.p1 GENE.gb/GEZN01020700.1/~~gb/GEZN01020700.1/.p1  ORF type:complete len:207 (+),score=6.53 gb/GEZN01020700.1/:61-621(+)
MLPQGRQSDSPPSLHENSSPRRLPRVQSSARSLPRVRSSHYLKRKVVKRRDVPILNRPSIYQRVDVNLEGFILKSIPTRKECVVYLSDDDSQLIFEEGPHQCPVFIDIFIGGITRHCLDSAASPVDNGERIMSLFFFAHNPVHLILGDKEAGDFISALHSLQSQRLRGRHRHYLASPPHIFDAIPE